VLQTASPHAVSGDFPRTRFHRDLHIGAGRDWEKRPEIEYSLSTFLQILNVSACELIELKQAFSVPILASVDGVDHNQLQLFDF
jgi:hypothetical protein